MRVKLLTLLVLALPAWTGAAEDQCLTCHQDFEDEDTGPSYQFLRDAHYQKGLGCADCHGGDPTLDDMDAVRESRDWRGVPDHREVPQFCARCHSDPAYMHEHNPGLPTDQLEKYKTSVHGQRLFGKNDPKVANCVSCHTAHEIADEKMPHSSTHPQKLPYTCGKCHADPEYMKEYGIPTDQLELYVKSVHGKALFERNDLSAPACNDCHGNHGAAPPGVSSLAAVCGNCHAIEAELFEKSPHMVAFQENDFPLCETCHGNHGIIKPDDSLVGPEPPALCADCHEPDDGTAGIATADSMLTVISTLKARAMAAQDRLEEAKEKGMMTVDEELRFDEVQQALMQARIQIHAFGLEGITEQATLGLAKADTVLANSEKLIDEYYFRRKGLALSTLFISIVVIGLYLKIRRMG